MQLPLRLSIATVDGARQASFTIHGIPFMQIPTARDRFVLLGHVFEVDHLLHFVEEEPAVIVVTIERRLSTRTDFYGLLDQFKAAYDLADFTANVDEPDLYYMIWRAVRQLMGVQGTELPNDQVTIKLFAELCRAAVLAASQQQPDSGAFAELPQAIHQAVAATKERTFDPLQILEHMQLDVTTGQLDIKLVAQHAIVLLKRYRTIPTERMQLIHATA